MTKDFALNVHKLCNAQTLATKRNASIIQCDADKEPGKGPTTYDDAAKLDGAWFKNQTTDLQLAVEDMVAAFKRRQLLSDKYQAKVKEVSGCSGEKRELKKKEKDKIYEIVQQVVEALCQDLEIELREIFPVVQNTLGVYSKSIGYFLIGRPQSVRVVSSQIN